MLNIWRTLSVLLIASISLGNGEGQPQPSKNIPQGETKVKANGSVKIKKDSNPHKNNSPPTSDPVAIPNGTNFIKETQHSEKQGTESFLLFGYLFRISDVLLVSFTALLWFSTRKLWKEAVNASSIAEKSSNAALLTAQNMQTTERAYVKMSHTDPGLIFREGETTESYQVEIKIENCGKTPATVTEARLRFMVRDWGESLPSIIDYTDSDAAERPSNAFLVPGDFFFIRRGSGIDRHAIIRNDAKRLILFGYVDYTDVFGQQHRAGYAREYRTVRGNNLFLIAAKGYNYDRSRLETDRQDQDTIES